MEQIIAKISKGQEPSSFADKTIDIVFYERNGKIFDPIMYLSLNADYFRIGMDILNALQKWCEKDNGNRTVTIHPINPDKPNMLHAQAQILDRDSVAVITQHLGGVPRIGGFGDWMLP